MDSHLDQLFEFLRFPSISTDTRHTSDVQACADFLIKKLGEIGLQPELHTTARHPIVIARNQHQPGRPTVMIYGHYDVQPVDPLDLWNTPPFEPTLIGDKIYARGATDNKGQMFAHLLGVAETLKHKQELPVNLIFLFEGEEEIGSPNLAPFLHANRDALACDIIAVSDTGMVAPGVPTLGYGLRGITCCEVFLKGPKSDLHSGVYGGAVANPATAISRLIASLHDANGRVAIPGFYDDVVEIATWEREMWAKIPGHSDQDLLANTGSPAPFGEASYSSIERTGARPTAEVNGIGGGYQGEGSKTVLPAEAFAKLSFRLVPDQDPDDIARKIQAHLQQHCPEGVTLETKHGHSGKPYYFDPNSRYGLAAQNALRKTFNQTPVLMREGGSIPIIKDFQEILGSESIMLGLALPDCQIHAPNENFSVENFRAGIKLNQYLLEALAQA